MSRRYEEKNIPSSTHTVLAEIKCDLCPKTTKQNWKKDSYDAADSEVTLRTGSNYPEGGMGEITTIDICPECFETKLVPWVRSQGGEPITKEWDR